MFNRPQGLVFADMSPRWDLPRRTGFRCVRARFSAFITYAGLDLAGPGDELSRVVAAAVCLPARRPLVAPGPDELGRLLVEQRVERLLDGPPHQILYVLAQRLLVDCYDVRRHGPCPLRR